MTKLEIAERTNVKAYNVWLKHYDKYDIAEKKFKSRCTHYRRAEKAYAVWMQALDAVDQLKKLKKARQE